MSICACFAYVAYAQEGLKGMILGLRCHGWGTTRPASLCAAGALRHYLP